MKHHFSKKLTYILLVLTPFVASCGTSGYESPEENEEEISRSAPVPPDGTLETVTWNLEWFGDGTYGDGGNGPGDEQQQIQHIVQVMDSLKADLYAFQEVYGQKALNDITQHLSGYKGFVADHIDWVQKTAFVYNTNVIDSLAAGPISNGQDEEAWVGRLPLYFKFNYTFGNSTTEEIYAIVIHAVANSGYNKDYDYQRRKQAAQDLYDYLMEQKPNANIIFLGDYNDDVDVSIFNNAETPYQPFVADATNFRVLTKTLSEAGEKSTVSYSDMIDHITVSDELFNQYINESAAVFTSPKRFIPYYGNTTSDHYPVWAKFEMAE